MRPALLPQLLTLIIGLAVSGYGLYTLLATERGINIARVHLGSTPVTVYKREDLPGSAPVVVISHGFAGSQQLMQSFSLSLARSGFVAVAFDYLGHGRNLAPLTGDITRVEGATQALLAQTREVVDYALALPEANGELAILGHSMASDIIVRYAQQDPRVRATVAVSMFSTAVTPEEPRNLLVIVGGLEGFLKDEALRVLGMVTDEPVEGVTVGRFDDGSARRVVFAAGVEHVGVLYSRESLSEAARWLRAVFGAATIRTAAESIDPEAPRQAGSGEMPATPAVAGNAAEAAVKAPVSGQRGIAIMSVLLGLSFLAYPVARNLPRVTESPRGAALSWRQLLLAGLAPAIVTPLLLMQFPPDFLGALVGGYLAVHFLAYGLLSALCLWWLGRDTQRPDRGPTDGRRFALATAIAVFYFAGVFALVLDRFVTSYAITSTRLPLLLMTGVGTLAYFLSDEWMTHGASTARGGHLFTRCCFLLSLGLAVALSFEDLFFLLIIAAVIVIYFLLYGLFSRWIYRATGHPAVAAIANAVTFAWALAAVFPFLSP